MKFAFRTDASLQIGSGHVMRCLTLADALRERGAKCTFICRPHQGHLLDLIINRNHKAVTLPPLEVDSHVSVGSAHTTWLGTNWYSDADQTSELLTQQQIDWLVVDHYALDYRWEQRLRPYCQYMMVIDDLADRPHECDLLLDQNLGRVKSDYDGLLNDKTRLLIGPYYALLRPEFAKWRHYSIQRRATAQFKKLLISMGGIDKDNTTCQVLNALKDSQLPDDIEIIVIMGSQAPWLTQVQQLASQMPWHTQILVGVGEMAQLIAESDLAIGAAGGMAWERCALGIASLIIILADNQRSGAIALQNKNAAIMLESPQNLSKSLNYILNSPDYEVNLKKLSCAAADLTDGLGTIRVIQEISSIHV